MPTQTSLCLGCAEKLVLNLSMIAGSDTLLSLVEELDITITRTDCIGTASLGVLVGGGGETPQVFHPKASDLQGVLRSVTRYWGLTFRNLHPHLTWPGGERADVIARWMLLFPDLLSEHPHAGMMVTDIGSIVGRVFRVIDRPADRVFIGPCGGQISVDRQCDESLYGIAGRSHLRCRGCGVVWDLAERRADLKARAVDTLAPASDMVGFETVFGREVTADMLNSWKRRGMITTHGVDGRGRALFRVGDIQAVLDRRKQRKGLPSNARSDGSLQT